MKGLRTSAKVSFGMGLASLLLMLVCHLALTDIWHGEGDLSMEWRFLQVAFLFIGLFHLLALTTLARLLWARRLNS